MTRIMGHNLVNALTLLVELVLCRLLDCLLNVLSFGLYLMVGTQWLAHLPICLIGLYSCDCVSIDVTHLNLGVGDCTIVFVDSVVLSSPLPI